MIIRRKGLYFFALLLLVSGYSQLIFAYSDDNPITIGLFPRRNAVKTISNFKPLEIYLSKKLKRKVILQVSKDFPSFWARVEQGKFDLVHYNQYHYMVSHKKFGYNVILKNKEMGESTITGSIIVRKDSGINSVKDLVGKKILFGGGPRAMQSYIYARYLLEENGLKQNDYSIHFAKTPINAILATYFKQADAAGSGDKNLQLEVISDLIDVSKLKYLVKGKQLAHLPWAVHKSVPLTMQRSIQTILSDLKNTKKGRDVLRAAELDSFELATDAEYNQHRLIVEKVLGEKY